MEQFSLEKWLQDKGRKVVTRQGNPVRIICTDRKHTQSWPIVALESYNSGEFVLYANDKGRTDLANENIHDLFFADDEGLTEFEKDLQIIISEASHWTSDDGSMSTYCQFGDKEIKKISVQILDLARKEVLKSLPKWKKMPHGIQGNGGFNPTYLVRTSCGHYFTTPCLSWDENSMYIELSELEKLPKE